MTVTAINGEITHDFSKQVWAEMPTDKDGWVEVVEVVTEPASVKAAKVQSEAEKNK